MLARFHSRIIFNAFILALLLLVCASPLRAQESDELSDDAADPIKLFHRGQNAHARFQKSHDRQDLEQALEFYQEAIRLRPQFPEAEYQSGLALVTLGRAAEGEQAYRRALELWPDSPLPYAALGGLLARAGRDKEAEPLLSRALSLDADNLSALVALAGVRGRAGELGAAAQLWRRATAVEAGDAALWAARGTAERAAKDAAGALASLSRALELDSRHVSARIQRAELYLEAHDNARALADLRVLQDAARRDVKLAVHVADMYARAGRPEEARLILSYVPEETKRAVEVRRLETALSAVNCEDTAETRAALGKLLEREPRNASLLACLGELNRTTDPERALDYFKRAVELESNNVRYATGYASALLQLRKFPEAATILRRIITVAPDEYAAHANLATALYEMRLYKPSLVEYEWITRARPDLAVVYFFIGSAHDRLGEYPEALGAYETFLARADAAHHQLEIEKVNLRLPSLRAQIKRGEGKKKKSLR